MQPIDVLVGGMEGIRGAANMVAVSASKQFVAIGPHLFCCGDGSVHLRPSGAGAPLCPLQLRSLLQPLFLQWLT